MRMTARTFDLAAYLKARGERFNRALDRRLPPASTRPHALHEAMRYSLFPGGKRLRPLLCIAAAESVSARPSAATREAALCAAIAVELLHTYTLVHDDLPCMDDDDERRGKPTVHVVYGEANAVLAGDALQTLAFEWLARADRARPGIAAGLVRELATAAGSRGVIAGQVEDIAAVGHKPSASLVAYIHRHKTADLFRAAVRMGGLAAAAPPPVLAALGRYGNALGEAFQITDDLLDAAPPSPSRAGAKPPPPTELSCLAVMDAATARRRAQRLGQSAVRAVAALAPAGRRPLIAIAEAVVDRTT